MNNFKYINVAVGDGFVQIVFSSNFTHAYILDIISSNLKPDARGGEYPKRSAIVSAGFCSKDGDNFIPFGKSDSLKLGSTAFDVVDFTDFCKDGLMFMQDDALSGVILFKEGFLSFDDFVENDRIILGKVSQEGLALANQYDFPDISIELAQEVESHIQYFGAEWNLKNKDNFGKYVPYDILKL